MSVLLLNNYYFVDNLGLVPRIKSLTRDTTQARWRICPTNDNGKFYMNFPDADYGGADKSCEAAIRTIRRISDILQPKFRTIVKERKDKVVPLKNPGIILRTIVTKSTTWYYFRVTNPLTRGYEDILIGNDLNKNERWERAFTHARNVRISILYRKRKKARLERKDEKVILSM